MASIVRYYKQLFRFQKVFLQAGQSQTVSFSIPASELAFYNIDMELVVEPGKFNVWVGLDSTDASSLAGAFYVR